MAGPTPVSALIHAATMVTAGVYMVARLNFVFALSPAAMGWVAFVGALTALFAASIGFFQYDIKKVLAYSTVSQLGFMFIGVGVGAYWAGVYHLLTHAFFKASLFLGSGSVILGCHHEQDMRKMGGLGKLMPITEWTYLVACWAIAGFPWASGFYSKDEILWKAFTQEGMAFPFLGFTPHLGQLIYLMGIIAATGTSFYMFRSYYMTFTGEYRGGHGHGHGHDHDHGHGHVPKESPLSITLVLVALAAGAVLAAVIGIPYAWTGHAPILEHWLAPALPAVVHFAETSHAHGVPVPGHRRVGRRDRLGLRARALQGRQEPGRRRGCASAGRASGRWSTTSTTSTSSTRRRSSAARSPSRASARGSTSTSSTGW